MEVQEFLRRYGTHSRTHNKALVMLQTHTPSTLLILSSWPRCCSSSTIVAGHLGPNLLRNCSNLDNVSDVFALKDVVLTIRPQTVEKSRHATLICSYDLEGASLYYVKWYRGTYEFYRYTPSEKPTTKLFPFKAINVDVSNRVSSLKIRNIIAIKFCLVMKFLVKELRTVCCFLQMNRSNSTQVVLTDIDFQLSGNFSCEVTTAEEPASTQTAVKSMLVVRKCHY